MKIIIEQLDANIEQIRLNAEAIALMRAGYGTRTRDAIQRDFRDDTAESIAGLVGCNAELLRANVILSSAAA